MSSSFKVGQWLVNPQLDEISRIGETLKLEPRMVRLLARLAENPGEVVSTQQLLESVWPGVIVGPASVYQAISQLRKVLGDVETTPTYIATVARKGYRLIAEVEPLASPQRDAKTHTQPRRPRWPPIAAAAAICVIALLSVLFLVRHGSTPAVTQGAIAPGAASDARDHTVAVLPFDIASDGSGDELLAYAITGLLRDRLAALPGATVIAESSTAKFLGIDIDAHEVGDKLQARFLLRGAASRDGAALRVVLSLVDAYSRQPLWSRTISEPKTNLLVVGDQVTTAVAKALDLPNAQPPARPPLDLDVYLLYARGRELLAAGKITDIELAQTLFARSVALDANFARGYLGLGNALVREAALRQKWTDSASAASERAFTRALELDPALGEVWLGRALSAQYPANDDNADSLFRQAVKFAPNESAAYVSYSEFLFRRLRPREALAMVIRARALDPLSTQLIMFNAMLVMNVRSDVTESRRLAQQALDIEPENAQALLWLASAQPDRTAEAVRLIERVVRYGPNVGAYMQLGQMYLALDDVDAATNVMALRATHAGSTTNAHGDVWGNLFKLQLALHEHDVPGAAAIARGLADNWMMWRCCEVSEMAQAVRDDAIRTGDFKPALELLESIYATPRPATLYSRPVTGLIYAHTLILAGQKERGIALVKAALARLDVEDSGLPHEHWLAAERAVAFELLDDDDHALQELAHAQEQNPLAIGAYAAEFDPLWEHLRNDPRFQALVNTGKEYRAQQRALLDEMRRKDQIPMRVARAPTT